MENSVAAKNRFAAPIHHIALNNYTAKYNTTHAVRLLVAIAPYVILKNGIFLGQLNSKGTRIYRSTCSAPVCQELHSVKPIGYTTMTNECRIDCCI